ARAHRLHLQRVAAARTRADPGFDASRIDDADADHRHVAALFLRDELPPHQSIDGRVDRFAAFVALGAADHDPDHDSRARILFAARFNYPDDGTDHFTAVEGGWF